MLFQINMYIINIDVIYNIKNTLKIIVCFKSYICTRKRKFN